jgi:hypothetical protein
MRRWKKLLARYTGDCDALRRELVVERELDLYI